ncbi:hypothetical protein STEG23_032865 [Scotinomys teguina]
MIFPSGSGHPGAAGSCRTPYRKQVRLRGSPGLRRQRGAVTVFRKEAAGGEMPGGPGPGPAERSDYPSTQAELGKVELQLRNVVLVTECVDLSSADFKGSFTFGVGRGGRRYPTGCRFNFLQGIDIQRFSSLWSMPVVVFGSLCLDIDYEEVVFQDTGRSEFQSA